MRTLMLTAALALCMGLAEPPAAGAIVNIDNFSFTPAEITVGRGATITWINRDDIPHTVTGAEAKLIKSPVLDTDEQFTHRFDIAGRFTYFCSLHAHMKGVVIVQ